MPFGIIQKDMHEVCESYVKGKGGEPRLKGNTTTITPPRGQVKGVV